MFLGKKFYHFLRVVGGIEGEGVSFRGRRAEQGQGREPADVSKRRSEDTRALRAEISSLLHMGGSFF